MAKKQAEVRRIVFGLWFWCEIFAILRQLSRRGGFRFVKYLFRGFIFFRLRNIHIWVTAICVFRHLVLHSFGISSFWRVV